MARVFWAAVVGLLLSGCFLSRQEAPRSIWSSAPFGTKLQREWDAEIERLDAEKRTR